MSSLSSLLLHYYFYLSDDSTDASLFESSSPYWWSSVSCLIKSSAPLSVIYSRRPLCKRSGNCIALFGTVSLQIRVFGSLIDKEGFCEKEIFFNNMMDAHNILDSALGVTVFFLLESIGICRIKNYVTCLKYVSIFMQFMRKIFQLYNIIA